MPGGGPNMPYSPAQTGANTVYPPYPTQPGGYPPSTTPYPVYPPASTAGYPPSQPPTSYPPPYSAGGITYPPYPSTTSSVPTGVSCPRCRCLYITEIMFIVVSY